jgi:hypothetical protein
MLESDETRSGDGKPIDGREFEFFRNQWAHDLGVDPIVEEGSSSDDAFKGGKHIGTP